MRRREFMRTGAMGSLIAPLISRGWIPPPWIYDHGISVLEIIPRSEWAGALAPTGPLSSEDVRFLRDDVPALLRGFFEYHTTAENGWHDIAYNFLIDRFGRIWEERAGSVSGPVAGDATGGNQAYTQLVSLTGNFSAEFPTQEALDSLVSILAWLGETYDVDTRPRASVSIVSRGSNRWPEGMELEVPTIAGHRDMSLTECPGDVLYAYVTDGLAADVTALRKAASATTTTTAATSTSSVTTRRLCVI